MEGQPGFPNGVQRGNEFVVGNINGDRGRSLSVNTKTGVWYDFGNGAAEPQIGNDFGGGRAYKAKARDGLRKGGEGSRFISV